MFKKRTSLYFFSFKNYNCSKVNQTGGISTCVIYL
nr:MAG TPA: hypothetical protein [Caudoviricetes sp.]